MKNMTRTPRFHWRGVASILAVAACAPADAGDWPWWRGPNRNGVAEAQPDPPTIFSDSSSVLWNTPVPGRGHGSPAVVGSRVFLQTADEKAQTQSVLCFDRKSGRLLWTTEVHRGGFPQSNAKASHASSSPACDGDRVYVTFMSHGVVTASALSLEGRLLWQTKVSDFIVHQDYPASPALHGSLVIVAADHKGGGALCALDQTDGNVVWKVDRPKFPSYASPIVLRTGGRDQLLLSGCERVSSFDPLTGTKLWEIQGSTTECVTSIVTDGQRIFASGGYPKNHVAAITSDGSGTIAWENISRVYVPSMLVHDGHLYAVMDSGIAVCWKSDTGETQWKERLGGTFSSSPVIVGSHIYAANEAGTFFVFKADPARLHLVAENKLADEAFATPAICDGQIFARVARKSDDSRQEILYCIGRPDAEPPASRTPKN
jgi:outer membrane protein assembly factor BamB